MVITLLAFSVLCISLTVIAAALAVTLPVVSTVIKSLLAPLIVIGLVVLVLRRLH